MFINFGNNASLDGQGFATFGQITEGMDVVDSLYKDYGDGPPSGSGPNQTRLQSGSNAYLDNDKDFPKLDAITKAEIAP